MSMSMMNNSPGVCCVLEVQYARHLGFVILPSLCQQRQQQQQQQRQHRRISCNMEFGHNGQYTMYTAAVTDYT